MALILVPTLVLVVASLVISLMIWGGRRVIESRWPKGFWKPVLRWHIPLTVLYLFFAVPAFIGWFGVSRIGTRGDEREYVGPYLDGAGKWEMQARDDLRKVAENGGRIIEGTMIDGVDGVRLRVFTIPPDEKTPVRPFTAVIVHGLFRGALEVEPVGAMFRDLGCEVCIVETRNHGGSDRGPPTFGLRESQDLLAVVKALRARPGAAGRRIVLFGVSLGSAVAALAAPEMDGLAALVLDAPMAELVETADRVLDIRVGMPRPFRWLTMTSIGFWSDVDLADVRPVDALEKLPATLPALIIGGGDDRRMPPDVVRSCFDAMPAPDGIKRIWIRDGAGHGSVWTEDPAGYRRHLEALLDRIR